MSLSKYFEIEENLPRTQISIDNKPNCLRQDPHGGSCPKLHSTTDGYCCCWLHPHAHMELWTEKNTKQISHHDRIKFISILDCCPLREQRTLNF